MAKEQNRWTAPFDLCVFAFFSAAAFWPQVPCLLVQTETSDSTNLAYFVVTTLPPEDEDGILEILILQFAVTSEIISTLETWQWNAVELSKVNVTKFPC